MARIKEKTYAFDVPSDTASIHVYYKAGSLVGYGDPFIVVPFVAGQLHYEVKLPSVVPVTDGEWTLGASAFDATGNESDIGAVVTYPFDLVAPAAPTGGTVF